MSRQRCVLDLSLLVLQKAEAKRWPKPRSGWAALWTHLRDLFR